MNGSNSAFKLIYHNDYIRIVTRLVNIEIKKDHTLSQSQKEELFDKVESGIYHMYKSIIDECFNNNKTEQDCAYLILKKLLSR